MKRLTALGLVITAAWFVAFGIVITSKWFSAQSMGLNEWGDFLAGLTAPLALIWVVIGYFQQGEELRVNTEALKAQQEELRRQVEETAVLAKNSERQARAAEALASISRDDFEAGKQVSRESRRLKLKLVPGGGRSQGTEKIVVLNIGGSVSNVSISSGVASMLIRVSAGFHSGDKAEIGWSASAPQPVKFQINYDDSLSEPRKNQYEYSQDGGLQEKRKSKDL